MIITANSTAPTVPRLASGIQAAGAGQRVADRILISLRLREMCVGGKCVTGLVAVDGSSPKLALSYQ